MSQLSKEAIDAVDDFKDADTEYAMLQNLLLSGEFLNELEGRDLADKKEQFKGLIEQLSAKLEERNARLKTAQNKLRECVRMDTTQWRGPSGKPTVLSTDALTVSSVTRRSFDAKTLMSLCQKHGLLERLMELTKVGDDGQPKKLVQEAWDVDYEGVITWLRANKLEDVIDGAYDEQESTPQVKGAKPLAWLGEKKDK